MIHHAARFSTSPYTGDQKKVSTSVSNISGSVQPKRNSMSKLRDKILNDKESAGKGNEQYSDCSNHKILRSCYVIKLPHFSYHDEMYEDRIALFYTVMAK